MLGGGVKLLLCYPAELIYEAYSQVSTSNVRGDYKRRIYIQTEINSGKVQ
jgi:hypothetical protein